MKLKCICVFDPSYSSDFTVNKIYKVIEVIKNCFIIEDDEGEEWSVPLKGKLYEFELIQ